MILAMPPARVLRRDSLNSFGAATANFVWYGAACYVPPAPTITDVSYSLPANAVIATDGEHATASGKGSADFENLGVGKLCHAIGLAPQSRGATLPDFVGGVIGVCPEEEMLDVAAWRIVALVENLQPGWDRSPPKRPLKTMRPPVFAFMPSDAVSVIVASAGVQNAGRHAADYSVKM